MNTNLKPSLINKRKNLWKITVDGRDETGSLLYVTSEYIKMGLYYPFFIDGTRDHEHSFEEVILCLLAHPESFSVESCEEYYSKQEIEFLSRLQERLCLCTTQK